MNNKLIIALGLAAVIGGEASLRLCSFDNPAPSALKGGAEFIPMRGARMPSNQAPDVRTAAIFEPRRDDLVAGLLFAIWKDLNATNDDGHENVFTNLLPELTARDPEAAGKLVEGATVEQHREELMRELVQAWVAKDATAAWTWAERLPDTNEVQRALIYATEQMAETDPATAADAAARYLPVEGEAAVIGDIALTWAGKDLPGALAWATSQPAGERRNDIMARIAFVQSRVAPEAAANLVVNEILPGQAQNEAAISVLHQWALQDFASAQRWAESFPVGPLHERAINELGACEP